MLDVLGTPYSGINLSLSEGAADLAGRRPDLDRAQARPPADRRTTCGRCASGCTGPTPRPRSSSSRPTSRPRSSTSGSPRRSTSRSSGRSAARTRRSRSPRSSPRKVAKVPGAVDVHLAQVSQRARSSQLDDRPDRGAAGRPDRARRRERPAGLAGVERRRSRRRYWVDSRGVQYLVAVQTPQYAIDSIDALRATPISTGTSKAQTARQPRDRSSAATGPANITHFNVARTFDVQANVEGTDLGSVADAIDEIVAASARRRRRGTRDHGQAARSRAWTARSAACARAWCSRSCSSTC